MRKKNITLIALLLAASPWTAAQTVWRCGASYSQQPCAGGSAIAAPDAPSSPAEAAKAAAAARIDAQRADTLEKARLAQEKNAPQAVVIRPAEPPPARPVADKRGTAPKMGKLEEFTAIAPGTGKKKKKSKDSGK